MSNEEILLTWKLAIPFSIAVAATIAIIANKKIHRIETLIKEEEGSNSLPAGINILGNSGNTQVIINSPQSNQKLNE
jgi:hypothetical protein